MGANVVLVEHLHFSFSYSWVFLVIVFFDKYFKINFSFSLTKTTILVFPMY